jgi:hypothetical protein
MGLTMRPVVASVRHNLWADTNRFAVFHASPALLPDCYVAPLRQLSGAIRLRAERA